MTTKAKVEAIFEEFENILPYLYGRWQDEHEFEDINDYLTPLNPIIEKHGGSQASMSKRPFGVAFVIDNRVAAITCNSREMRYSITAQTIDNSASPSP